MIDVQQLLEGLTAPQQEAAAFQKAGTFPSVEAAQKDPGVTGQSDLTKFFGDAPVGEILAKRAEGVVAQYKGPDDSVIQSQVFGPAVKELDAGTPSGQAWDDATALLKKLVTDD